MFYIETLFTHLSVTSLFMIETKFKLKSCFSGEYIGCNLFLLFLYQASTILYGVSPKSDFNIFRTLELSEALKSSNPF